MSRYPLFPIHSVQLASLYERGSDLCADQCLRLDKLHASFEHNDLPRLTAAIQRARAGCRPVIAMLGGHPIKLGLSRVIIDLMERGLITHVALNGAGIIHDYELATHGATSEDVAKWIRRGQFGLWEETSRLNDIITEAANIGEGLGEAVGRVIDDSRAKWAELSICAAGWRRGIPVTAHVGIGSDILHAMPNCNGAAIGKASYLDFLIFAASISNLEHGVFLNIGSAVAGPEVYLKALSAARNVARRRDESITHFTTAVFDLIELPADWRERSPHKTEAAYYFRPWKTILLRTVADGGTSFYFCGDHCHTLPALWQQLTKTAYPNSNT